MNNLLIGLELFLGPCVFLTYKFYVLAFLRACVLAGRREFFFLSMPPTHFCLYLKRKKI